jgi:hypothetical protein
MEDKIEATKIMAQTMLERHTALALHSDKLGDAVNGYVEQYTNTMKELSKQNKDFISEMENFEFNRMNGVSNNADDMAFEDDDSSRSSEEEINADFGGNYTEDKERIFDDDNNPFIENNVNKVAPVPAPSQINEPTVEINKK